MSNIEEQKNELRISAKKQRASLSAIQKEKSDKDLLNKLLSLPEFKNVHSVFTYISMPIKEVSTTGIIEFCLTEGTRVAVPVCKAHSRMDFYYISSLDETKQNKYGILEPEENKDRLASPSEADLIIIPGLKFDKRGYRLGWGGGFYDRYLKNCFCTKIGICYEDEITELLPVDNYDVKVDMLVTDKTIYKF